MTIAAPAPVEVTATLRQPNVLMDFARQQPLGAVSFVIIFLMMFAGIFSPLVAPYDPLTIDFAYGLIETHFRDSALSTRWVLVDRHVDCPGGYRGRRRQPDAE